MRPCGRFRACTCKLPLGESVVQPLDMSSYFKPAKDRYKQKLELAGLKLQDGPYLADEGSKSGALTCHVGPKSSMHGNIFAYFIKRPGTFTLQQLASWKQLEAYNYFKNNYVRTVYSSGCGSDVIVLKAKVNPSQSSPDLANGAWIISKEDGTIVSAHCTCKAG